MTARSPGPLRERPPEATVPFPPARPSAGRAARALAAACLACTAAFAPAPARAADVLDQYAATDRFRSGQPRGATVTPDGREVLFLRSGPRDRVNDLYALDLGTGQERVLLTAGRLLGGAAETLSVAERARRERLRMSARGIASFTLSRDGRRVLVPLSGRLFVLERASGAIRELSPDRKGALDARFSPDGAQVACVRGGDLCVIDLVSGAESRLAAHEGDRVTWGLPEFVAQEEMSRFEGYWWSPDSRRIVAQRTDETNVERLRISDPFRPEAEPVEFAYPRPGRANAQVTLAVFTVAGGAPVALQWDRAAYPYVCTVRWADGGPLTLLVMNREQTEEALLACDPGTGASRTLLVERDSAWLNLAQSAPRWIEGGRAFLWIAERDDSGPWLERRGAGGELQGRLTPPGLRVTEVLGVDEALGAAYVAATDDPAETHVWRVWLRAKRAPERLTRESGLHSMSFANDARFRVHTLRPVHGPARWVVEDATGRVLASLRSAAEPPPAEPAVEWLTVGPDSLRAFVVRPRDFDPRRRYPVVDWAYAGPHSLRVQKRAAGYVLEQWLADQGFIVVTVDGRGTPLRGRAWERAIRGDLIGPALADHVLGLRELAKRFPEMDPARIGVTGWSFGGYFTVLALERAPDLYRAGVAGAPVVDWRDYDTFYTERYLGLPRADSLAYARSSALTDAATLSRPLLVEHGTADDNVYFFNTLKLADALNRANRDWQMLPLPGQTHGVIEPEQVRQVYGRLADFLRSQLGAPTDAAPPRP
jgi:dipeptidyl-peptidase-4